VYVKELGSGQVATLRFKDHRENDDGLEGWKLFDSVHILKEDSDRNRDWVMGYMTSQ